MLPANFLGGKGRVGNMGGEEEKAGERGWLELPAGPWPQADCLAASSTGTKGPRNLGFYSKIPESISCMGCEGEDPFPA